MRAIRYSLIIGVALIAALLTLLISAGAAGTGDIAMSKQVHIYEPVMQSEFLPLILPARAIYETAPTVKVADKIVKTHKHPVVKATRQQKAPVSVKKSSYWVLDSNISWYGPGFYGHRTACGLKLTKTLIGVAHRTLPCGTLVTFKWGNITITAPVVDRGPYVIGRIFDMTGGLCTALHHCFTGSVYYRIGKVR
jgi:rare lipoprotein A (peptidoglycan hydrolase)